MSEVICNPECIEDFPPVDWINSCDIETRPGGICRGTFFRCVPDLVFPYPNGFKNPANVVWAMCQGILYVTGEILGQKPKGSVTKRRISSCGPEKSISGVKTVTWQDYNADKENLLDFIFYDAVAKNAKFMNFGWITCDERLYQYPGQFDIFADEVIEDNAEQGLSFWDVEMTMPTKEIIIPFNAPGVLAAINSFADGTCYLYS
jgi:hypothetical protein